MPNQNNFSEIPDEDSGAKSVSSSNGKSKQSTVPSKSSEVPPVSLPLWNLGEIAAPNAILRSAVFSAVGRGKRQVFKKPTPLASVSGVTILGFGIQLDQADLDVWQMCLNLAQSKPLGSLLELSSRAFLKSIHRADGKANRTWLKESLTRLQSFSIEVKSNDHAYVGSLINEFYIEESSGKYCINLNPKLKSLFDAGWTQLNFNTRLQLKGWPLAQWLVGFYSTHIRTLPYKIETLHKLSGSADNLKGFKRALKRALDHCFSNGTISSFNITESGLVSVNVGNVNNCQERHKLKLSKSISDISRKAA